MSAAATPNTAPPASCTGDCDCGTRDCTCGHTVIGMWDEERANPWRAALLYGLTITAALLASHCAATGGAA